MRARGVKNGLKSFTLYIFYFFLFITKLFFFYNVMPHLYLYLAIYGYYPGRDKKRHAPTLFELCQIALYYKGRFGHFRGA